MVRRRTDAELYDRVEVAGDCWLWTGSRDSHGYGHFKRDGRIVRAHRWFYENLVGDIGADLTIDHLCRVKLCVNPDHLEPVTRGENIRRGQKRHVCKNGHRRFPWNVYSSNGRCRICDKERHHK